MGELTVSEWSTLDRDRHELSEAIERETGLRVLGWTHVASGCGKPEFAEGVSVPWDRIGEIASGSLHPPGTEAEPGSGPAPKKKSKKPAKAKK